MDIVGIGSAGGVGTHRVRRTNINAEDDYIYFKDSNYVSNIPLSLTNGTGFIYGEGIGAIGNITDASLVFTEIISPTQVKLATENTLSTYYDVTSAGTTAGVITFNTPVVFDNRLNIDASTPTNQAVKYYTNGTTLNGLTSGDTYFLKNVSVSDFAGQQVLYELDNFPDDPVGQTAYTNAGTYTWTAPPGVTEVSVVAVGGGGGGARGNAAGSGAGGGGLGWKNRIPVSPGIGYTVVVGAGGNIGNNVGGNGGQSYFISPNVVAGFGGEGARANQNIRRNGGSFVGDGGGTGGHGGRRRNNGSAGGGGGAAGYSGNGGRGSGTDGSAQSGSGGGAGGGGYGGSGDTAGSGGGVGLNGQGSNGSPGINTNNDAPGGQGGSGGGNAARYGSTNGNYYSTNARSAPGDYGGGASSGDNTASYEVDAGGKGAVRIIWGSGRAYPSTRTANE